MAKNLIQRPLIFQDEDSDKYLKKGVIAGKSKSGKPEAVKKGIIGPKSRNPLNDITNKSTALPEESAKKKSSQKELKVPNEINIAEETFTHDHQKCVEAQTSATGPKHFLELVMPGCEGVIAGKSKSGKSEAVKKGITGPKSRNALNDITNKSTALPEEAAKKKSSQKELKVPNELNIAEEKFLHDHQKCVEAQRSALAPKHFMELVMPGCDSASPIDMLKTEMEMNDKGIDNPNGYPVPEESPMSEFSWLISSWKSPPEKRDSPPSSLLVEFTLKEEMDC